MLFRGNSAIKHLLCLCFVLIIGVLSADRLFAASTSVQQLPTTLKNGWSLCVQKSDAGDIDCQQQSSVSSIEDSFDDFNGIATYRTTFTLSDALKDTPVTLFIPHLRDADKVYINGQLIGQSGQFPPSFEKATLYSRSYPLPNHLLHYRNKSDNNSGGNELVINLFNHARQGGLSAGAPVIADTQTVYDEQIAAEGLLMLYIGVMLIIAAVQGFYYAAQPQNRDHLYFGVFCIGEALYILTYSHFAFTSGLHLNIIFRINIALFGLLTLLFFLFMTSFFKYRVPKWFKTSLIASLIIISLAALLIPIDAIYHLVHLLQAISVVILVPFYFYLFYQAIREKLPYAKLMAWTLVTFIVAVLFDFMVDLQIIPAFMSSLEGLVSPIILIAIFIVLTLILIHKHWLYYRNATYDYLTNCLRRSAFIERLNQELQRIHRSEDQVLLALLDLDDFKNINDKHNHIMGDHILRAVATRTSDALREFDLLGRYGGDEFIFAAQVSDEHDALQLLKRVHRNITQNPIVNNDKDAINISVTIGGVTTSPLEPVSAEELIEQADKVLVKGKIKQKGRVHI